jgi:hypothetical protein
MQFLKYNTMRFQVYGFHERANETEDFCYIFTLYGTVAQEPLLGPYYEQAETPTFLRDRPRRTLPT